MSPVRRVPKMLRSPALPALVAGLVIVASLAWATIPAKGGVIHACYNVKYGNVRLISGTKCRSGERYITWNQTGLRGPQGATGATGAAGADSTVPGPQGTPGPQGSPGTDSTVPGPKGDTGSTGPKGDTGSTGAQGPSWNSYCSTGAGQYAGSRESLCRTSKVTVDGTGDVGQYTSVAIGVDGFPVISYYDVTSKDLKVAHCTDASCFGQGSPIAAVSTGDVGKFSAIAIGADGRPVVSYYDDAGKLMFVRCTTTSCSDLDATPVELDAGAGVGQYSSIAIGTDGYPVVSYSGGSTLKVVHCTSRTCSTKSSVTVDTSSGVEQYTSIAIGSDGLPVVSYYDASSSDLKVARCTSASGCWSQTDPQWSKTVVDATGTTGSHTSIAIGADGNPVVSYYYATGQDLKVARCGDPGCTTGNTLATVDSTGDVGQYTSIGVGADGLPSVSYYDTAGKLKVAHCATACASWSTTSVDTGTGVGQYTSLVFGTDGFPVISYYDGSDLKVARAVI